MGEIINLNRARKARAKAEDKAPAAANRAAHGRSNAGKTLSAPGRQRAEKQVDGQQLEPKSDD